MMSTLSFQGSDRSSSCFIATQAPMAHTVIDFWRMVWHTNASGIVMITRLHEQGKVSRDNYVDFMISIANIVLWIDKVRIYSTPAAVIDK